MSNFFLPQPCNYLMQYLTVTNTEERKNIKDMIHKPVKYSMSPKRL